MANIPFLEACRNPKTQQWSNDIIINNTPVQCRLQPNVGFPDEFSLILSLLTLPPWAWMNVENFPLINLFLAEKNMFITTRSDQYCGSMHYAAIVKMVKIEIRDSSQISTTGPIFLLSNYFRQKYLEIASCAVSLLNNIWVRVEHSLLQQLKQKVNCS